MFACIQSLRPITAPILAIDSNSGNITNAAIMVNASMTYFSFENNGHSCNFSSISDCSKFIKFIAELASEQLRFNVTDIDLILPSENVSYEQKAELRARVSQFVKINRFYRRSSTVLMSVKDEISDGLYINIDLDTSSDFVVSVISHDDGFFDITSSIESKFPALESRELEIVSLLKQSLEKVLKDSNTLITDVTGAVLSGSLSKSNETLFNIIKQNLKSHSIPVFENYTIHPSKLAIHGAAIYGSYMSGHNGKKEIELVLCDFLPLSFGIETNNGHVKRVVSRSYHVPVIKSSNFTTSTENQTSVRLNIVLGEHLEVSKNKHVETVDFHQVTPMPMGHAIIQVTLTVDANQVLHVEIQDFQSGKTLVTKVTYPFLNVTNDYIFNNIQESSEVSCDAINTVQPVLPPVPSSSTATVHDEL